MREYINTYKQLIYTQIEYLDDTTDEGKEKFDNFMIELEAANYILLISEKLAKLYSKVIIKDKGKNAKLRFMLNELRIVVSGFPYKEIHEVKFKKGCNKVIDWLFFTIK